MQITYNHLICVVGKMHENKLIDAMGFLSGNIVQRLSGLTMYCFLKMSKWEAFFIEYGQFL